ncbi:MAG: alpha/beta fold hydrolase [Erysipelotrichaceae bacterium]|nr:alpha/beta fold hydrolase [Erysipelotrichaceae bacterium]
MKKTLWILLVLCLLLSGCTAKETKTSEAAPETVPQNETTGDALPDTEEFSYAFSPHVMAEEYKKIYGPGIEDVFYTFCDTVLEAGDSFACADREELFHLLTIAKSCFPLADGLVDREQSYVENGTAHLVYKNDPQEVRELAERFISKVESVIRSAIPCETADWIKAVELMTAVARKTVPDEEYTLEDSLSLSPYRAITEDTGICQEIAGEYIYYLLQVGIDAIPCGGLSSDQSFAHEWVLVKLDGKWYHVDPMFAASYPDSLFFFGMTDRQREHYGDLPPEGYDYAYSDMLKREDFEATDTRFLDLWLAESYTIDQERQTIHMTETREDDSMPKIEKLYNDEFSMRYFRFGNGGKTFVMLPGLSITSVMDSAAAVADAYQVFGGDYTVYLFDRRSDLPENYTIADMAGDTAKAFELLDLNDICLFGASQGGMIAMTIAAEYPDRIRKLVLGSTACRVSEEAEKGVGEWAKLAEEGKAEELVFGFAKLVYPEAVYKQSEPLLKAMAQTVTAEDLARFVILSSATKGFDVSDKLQQIRCPVLVLGAKDDAVLGPEAVEELIGKLEGNPGLQSYIYDGFGHAAYDLAPDYKDRMLAFFKD